MCQAVTISLRDAGLKHKRRSEDAGQRAIEERNLPFRVFVEKLSGEGNGALGLEEGRLTRGGHDGGVRVERGKMELLEARGAGGDEQ